jgi:hypothetical protein
MLLSHQVVRVGFGELHHHVVQRFESCAPNVLAAVAHHDLLHDRGRSRVGRRGATQASRESRGGASPSSLNASSACVHKLSLSGKPAKTVCSSHAFNAAASPMVAPPPLLSRVRLLRDRAASSRSRQQAAAGPAAGRAAQHCWCAAAGCSHRNRRPSFIAGPQQHPPPPSVLPRCRGAQQAQHRLAPWAAVLRGPPLVCPWEGSVVPVSCYLRWGSFEAATQGRGHGGMGLPAW